MSDLRKSKNIFAIHMLDDPDSMFKEGKEDSLAPSSGSLFVINFSSSVLHMFSQVNLLLFAMILCHLLVSFSCLILPVSIAAVLSSFFSLPLLIDVSTSIQYYKEHLPVNTTFFIKSVRFLTKFHVE